MGWPQPSHNTIQESQEGNEGVLEPPFPQLPGSPGCSFLHPGGNGKTGLKRCRGKEAVGWRGRCFPLPPSVVLIWP